MAGVPLSAVAECARDRSLPSCWLRGEDGFDDDVNDIEELLSGLKFLDDTEEETYVMYMVRHDKPALHLHRL